MIKRIEWVDMYKGLLIFLVVLGHAFQGIASDKALMLNKYYNSIFMSKMIIYSFHMPAFFIAAGFFSYNLFKKINITYFEHRFRRLAQPYFIWGFVTALFMQVASGKTNSGLGLKDFFYSPIKPFSIFWFLYVYLIIFIIHFSLSYIFGKNSNLIILILSTFMFLASPIVPNIWIFKNLFTYMVYYSIGLFALSIINKRGRKYVDKLWECFLYLILFLLVFIVYFKYMKVGNTVLVNYFGFLTSITGSILFINISIILSKAANYFTKITSYFGKYSMQIYVFHLLPLACARIIFTHFVYLSNLWLLTFIITIISLVACVIVIQMSKKLNLMQILF